MILFNIEELELIGAFGRGQPNIERIILRAKQSINLSSYGIMIGTHTGHKNVDYDNAVPILDYMYWFGNVDVDSNTHIFLYTGNGQYRITKVEQTNDPAVVYHWGKKYTLFTDPNIVPILFRMDCVTIGERQFLLENMPVKQD